jgi:hypothetical protein
MLWWWLGRARVSLGVAVAKISHLESEVTAEDIREQKKLVVPMHELELAIMSCVVVSLCPICIN